MPPIGQPILNFRPFRFLSQLLLIVLVSLPGVSLSASSYFIEPYVGVDLGLRRMAWKKGYGENIYKHGAFQSNIYAGLRVNPYWGIELGYEKIFSKKRDVYFASTQSVTILNIPLDGPQSVRSSVKLKGWHISMVGFCPLSCWKDFELLGTVGVTKLETKQQAFLFDPIRDDVLLRNFVKNKVVPRISVGFQYKLVDNFTFRAILVGIEKISPFDLGPPLENPSSDLRTKIKYNVYHSLGIVFTF